jgi:glycosyltransferase involved in cell wall biosynthesis
VRITLFMTRGMSLEAWEECGLLNREAALYERFRDRGAEVGIVSYGRRDALRFAERFPGIRILDNRWYIPRRLYEHLIARLHGSWLRGTDIVKSNQTDGAEVAMRAARASGARFVARCGFMLSTNTAREHGVESTFAKRAEKLEQRVFLGADRIIVTTDAMAEDIGRRLPGCAERTTVIPNYVDCGLFRPAPETTAETDLLFIGRLSREKNLEALLTAIAETTDTLSIVGDGEMAGALKSRFGDLGGRIKWRGIQPNASLPELLAKTRAYIQPSLYEGHPKTIIEAMAAGTAVIATDVPGIDTVIDHGRTGWLTGIDAAAIRTGIREVLDHPMRISALGQAARAQALATYDLEVLSEREMDMYADLLIQTRD